MKWIEIITEQEYFGCLCDWRSETLVEARGHLVMTAAESEKHLVTVSYTLRVQVEDTDEAR